MNRIRELRKAKGLTMKELGKELGLAESTVSLYERNLHEPDLETIRKLASFFSVTVDYLLGHTDIEENGKIEKSPADDPLTEQIMAKARQMNEEELRQLLRIMDAVTKK